MDHLKIDSITIIKVIILYNILHDSLQSNISLCIHPSLNLPKRALIALSLHIIKEFKEYDFLTFNLLIFLPTTNSFF